MAGDWYARYIDWTADQWSGRRPYGPLLIPLAAITVDAEAEHAAEVAVRKQRVQALTAPSVNRSAKRPQPRPGYHYIKCWAPPECLRAACEMAYGLASRELGLRNVAMDYCRPTFREAEEDRVIATLDVAVSGFAYADRSEIWINAWERSPASGAATVAHELAHVKAGGRSPRAASELYAQRYAGQFWARHGRQIEHRFALRVAA